MHSDKIRYTHYIHILLEKTHAVKNVLSAPNVKVVKCCNSGLFGSQDRSSVGRRSLHRRDLGFGRRTEFLNVIILDAFTEIVYCNILFMI